MTVFELKQILQDLPDEYEIVTEKYCYDDKNHYYGDSCVEVDEDSGWVVVS